MARKKAAASEEQVFGEDSDALDLDNAAAEREMRSRGYESMSGGTYRFGNRSLSDELVEEF